MMSFDIYYQYADVTKLRKAWEAYYDKLGLSWSKRISKVNMRISKGKFPSNG